MIYMRSNHGFSMVELIIVIAVMAILAGALAPTLIKYVNKSRIASDLDSADTLAKAAQLAVVDHEVAKYIFTQSMPFSIDVQDLDATHSPYEELLLENIGSIPKVKYTKNNAQSFMITVVERDAAQHAYAVEITVVGAPVTSQSGLAANPNGVGAMLYPEVDDAYKQ
ncbi:MAG: prepilin-type N-terminal cleavage/methylation domain-containing protein [Lachnospiraceae bacterium]|nr:prepilin-type N-terminal cleavage/methylation domain-containing protein [Lachnospiraceae bacterium]